MKSRRCSHSSRMTVACHLKRSLPKERGRGCPAVRRLLLDLAPDGVCHAGNVTIPPVSSCLAVSPLPYEYGGLFSVVLSLRLPSVAVSDHPSSRSPDFPLHGRFQPCSDCMSISGRRPRLLPCCHIPVNLFKRFFYLLIYANFRLIARSVCVITLVNMKNYV